jgi:hypothetical protein
MVVTYLPYVRLAGFGACALAVNAKGMAAMASGKSDGAEPGLVRESSYLVVINNYQWIGDPRAAGFVVYIDGRRVGVAALGDRLSTTVAPGAHVLRVRFTWYWSPRVTTSLKAGETKEFSADIPRHLPFWRRMLRAIFTPLAALSLEEQWP